MTDIQLYKIAILTDMLDAELKNSLINDMTDPIAQSKFRNHKRSTNIMVRYFDQVFEDEEIQEAFGEFSDKINSLIDKELEILK